MINSMHTNDFLNNKPMLYLQWILAKITRDVWDDALQAQLQTIRKTHVSTRHNIQYCEL